MAGCVLEHGWLVSGLEPSSEDASSTVKRDTKSATRAACGNSLSTAQHVKRSMQNPDYSVCAKQAEPTARNISHGKQSIGQLSDTSYVRASIQAA